MSSNTQPCVILLPNAGTTGPVYLVVTALLSTKSAEDVRQTIQTSSPKYIVLPAEEKTLETIKEDARPMQLRLQELAPPNASAVLQDLWQGRLVKNVLLLHHLAAAAVMGVGWSADVLAAVSAAEQNNAVTVLGGAGGSFSMQHFLRMLRKANMAGNKGFDPSSLPSIGGVPGSSKNTADDVGFGSDLGTDSSSGKDTDPWGLGPAPAGAPAGATAVGAPLSKNEQKELINKRLTKVLQDAGVQDAEAKIQALERITTGIGSGSKTFSPADVLLVREGAQTYTEHNRQQAVKRARKVLFGGSDESQDPARPSDSAPGGPSGASSGEGPSEGAVFGGGPLIDDRRAPGSKPLQDSEAYLYAKRMYFASQRAQGEAVVALVRTPMVADVCRCWQQLQKQDASTLIDDPLTAPGPPVGGPLGPHMRDPNQRGIPVGSILTLVGLGLFYRRFPRAGKVLIGGTALMTAGGVYAMTSAVYRERQSVAALVHACTTLPGGGNADGFGDTFS